MGLELVEVHFLDTFPQVVTTTSVLSELIALQSLISISKQIITVQTNQKEIIVRLTQKSKPVQFFFLSLSNIAQNEAF